MTDNTDVFLDTLLPGKLFSMSCWIWATLQLATIYSFLFHFISFWVESDISDLVQDCGISSVLVMDL